MTHIPEDVIEALHKQPGVVRQHALEQALKYALAASAALDVTTGREGENNVPRAHIQSLAQVSKAWSSLADALKLPSSP